jgi:hypothetical protein
LFLRQRQRLSFLAQVILHFDRRSVGFHKTPEDSKVDNMSAIIY